MADSLHRPARWFVGRYGVSTSTLKSWEKKGLIRALRSPGGKRLYDVASVSTALGDTARLTPQNSRRGVIYARVSSPKQRQAGDLERQVTALQEAYPNHDVIRDVGSGVNFKRKGMRALLDRCFQGVVSEVVVLHKDRLSRFATDLLEYILAKNGVKLVVHRPSNGGDEFGDLADDLLAITTHFVASHHGRRSAAHRRERQGQAAPEQEGEAQTNG